MRLTQTFCKKENALLTYCKEYSGSYLNNLNRHRSPCATTYSNEFCNGVADLIKLYKKYEVGEPTKRLLEQFLAYDIRSCRGTVMDTKKVDYLFKTHVASKAKVNKFIVLDTLNNKEQCPVCHKWKNNLAAHKLAAH